MADQSARMSKNERREQAREQARLAREAEKKREKRKRFFVQGGVVLGVLAILAVVALIVVQINKPAGPGPQNMLSGGAVFTQQDNVIEVAETPALQNGEDRVAPETDRDSLPIDVTVYADYLCNHCGEFEQQNGEMLETYVGSGDITLQVYPVSIISSGGSGYSTRAANLFGCLVDQQPDTALDLHNRLLSAEVQGVALQNGGLTDEQMLEQAELSGAELTTELRQCVKDVRYKEFFAQNTKVATDSGVLGLEPDAQLSDVRNPGELQPADGPQRLMATPLAIVNGEEWLNDGKLENYLLKLKDRIETNGASADADDSGSADAAAEETE